MMFNLARNVVSRTVFNIHVGALINSKDGYNLTSKAPEKNYRIINMNITNDGEQQKYGYLKNLMIKFRK
jgi:hypothetical protein